MKKHSTRQVFLNTRCRGRETSTQHEVILAASLASLATFEHREKLALQRAAAQIGMQNLRQLDDLFGSIATSQCEMTFGESQLARNQRSLPGLERRSISRHFVSASS